MQSNIEELMKMAFERWRIDRFIRFGILLKAVIVTFQTVERQLNNGLLLYSALLSGTLRTIQRAACDGETLTLRCPLGTAVSIQLAQYGRPAPGLALCPEHSNEHHHSLALGAANFTESCTITPQMQVLLLHSV